MRTLPEGKNGLPVAAHRPGWLARRDELVVDARPRQQGGMLIMQLVLMDAWPWRVMPLPLRMPLAIGARLTLSGRAGCVPFWPRTGITPACTATPWLLGSCSNTCFMCFRRFSVSHGCVPCCSRSVFGLRGGREVETHAAIDGMATAAVLREEPRRVHQALGA